MLYPSYVVFLFGCFALVIYMMAVDRNVSDYIILTLARIKINGARLLFMAKMYPKLRYETFLLKHRPNKISKKYMDMAKTIVSELEDNEKL